LLPGPKDVNNPVVFYLRRTRPQRAMLPLLHTDIPRRDSLTHHLDLSKDKHLVRLDI